jgi:ankyrin repeat protein
LNLSGLHFASQSKGILKMLFGLFGGKKKKNKQLQEAASDGRMDDVASLLKRGADINEPDVESGEIPLTLAIYGGHLEVAEFLISSGADVNFLSAQGITPLLAAAYQGENGLALCRRLLEVGAQVNFGPSEGEYAGLTALYVAASKGAEKPFDLFLDAGAKLTARLKGGNTLMYAAAMGGNPKIIRTLGERGIDPNGKDHGGRRPIHIATIADHTKAIRCFIELGVPVDQLSEEDETPLLVAAINNKVAAAKVLIENGADVLYAIKPGDDKMTPLLIAATNGFDNIVKLLLDAGANPESLVRDNKTILDYAKASKRKSTVKLLETRVAPTKSAAKAKAKPKGAPEKHERPATSPAGSIAIPSFTVKEPEPSAPKLASAKPTSQTGSASSTIQLGVYCTDLRYDEEDHGDSLPAAFKKAQVAWIKSKNDRASPHYAEACRLLANWFECRFTGAPDLSVEFSVNAETNKVSRGKTREKEYFQAVEYAFDGEPKLKRFEVASVDFREETSNEAFAKGQAVLQSPEVGLVAIYETKTKESFRGAKALGEWIKDNDELVSRRFQLRIKEEAITTVEVDEDGDEYTSSSASWSGGDPCFLVNFGNEEAEFLAKIKNKVAQAHADVYLLDYNESPLKKAIILADLGELSGIIKNGADIVSPIDGLTPIQTCLIAIYHHEQYFDYDDAHDALEARFKTAGTYREALITGLKELLKAGADVNVNVKEMPVVGLIELLDDADLSALCRAGIKSAKTIDDAVLVSLAERADIDGIKEYVRLGAKVDPKERSAHTPLMYACQGPGGEDEPPLSGQALARHENAVKLLLSLGANVNAKSTDGDTAIGDAVRRGNATIVQLLLDAGAKTAGALPGKQTLLSLAKRRNHTDVIRVLEQVAKATNR